MGNIQRNGMSSQLSFEFVILNGFIGTFSVVPRVAAGEVRVEYSF